jgi:putative photosynthetic complex assembly protein
MRDALNDNNVSPVALLLIAGLLVTVFTGVATYRWSGMRPEGNPFSTIVETRALHFVDKPDGSIEIFDQGATKPFDIAAPQTNGFLRGTLRGLARARKLNHAGAEPPFELVRFADGRLSLRDPVDGREIAMEPFGQSNSDVFKRLLTLKAVSP